MTDHPGPLNWHVSDTDAALIRKIADRAMNEMGVILGNAHITRINVIMDIQACHANGNPLDLAALLEFPRFDFSHDIAGIIGHLNRDTGKLTNFFSPRCTARQPDPWVYAESLIEQARSVD